MINILQSNTPIQFPQAQMQSKVQDIKLNLKQARNNAYLCRYDQSLKQFKKIIETVQQQIMLNNIHKAHLQQWRVFQHEIMLQRNAVEGCKNSLLVMHPGPYFVAPTPQRRTINQNFRTSKGFSKPQTKQRISPFKDPDVWQTPPPIQRKPNQNKTNPVTRPSNKAKSKKIIDGKGKKTFLGDRYPDGNGPDSNLIEMLERQVMEKSPKVTFQDIAELQTAKGLLQEAVLLPLKMPQFFTGIRRAWRGVLMFGPPGTGKTLLAKAVASDGGTTFFNVSASSLASKWKGESQKLVRILFEMAKYYAPSVIFFDEIDALGAKRKDGEDESNRKVKTELLVQMDGATSSTNEANKFVIVLAATNRPWDLDEALRRRLEKRIYIPLPTEKGRKELISINLKNVQMEPGMDFDFIVKKTQGFSGADLTNVCREAAYMPMRRKLKDQGGFTKIIDLKKFQQDVNIPLKKEDFLQALKNVNKSVGKDDLVKYQVWMKQFGTV